MLTGNLLVCGDITREFFLIFQTINSRTGTSMSLIAEILADHKSEILSDWIAQQLADRDMRSNAMKDSELREHSREFIDVLHEVLRSTDNMDLMNPAWDPVRDFLSGISHSRARQGFTSAETATFIFSLKLPLFNHLRTAAGSNGDKYAEELWAASILVDKLGLWTMDVHQKSREAIIARQQQELLELSTPVVRLWEGVLALPLIGTLDSARTQVVMENLLQEIVETGAPIAIIDITGVPTVDTLVAQHLLKTVAAARLMGADCIISGIRPQIAQTIVHLGVNLNDVVTKATLADAFSIALQRSGRVIRRLTPQ
jgi:rsbT co-antagonist protein RsbR